MSMSRPLLHADEGRRRLRSTTGITALAATAAAALFGVLFAQPDDEQAAASPPVAPLPQLAPPPQVEPSPTAADPAAADATVAATPAPAPRRQHVHRSTPAPPPQPPARSSGRAKVSSGAS